MNLYCVIFTKSQLIFTVPCAVGTYFDQANKTCTPCPQGSYQSETGQLQCLRCPNIAGRLGVTAGSGARSAADCKGKHPKFECQIDDLLNCLIFNFHSSTLQNVVRLVNSWIRKVVYAVHVVTDSINRMKVHSHVYCAVLVKQRVQLKQHHVMNVAMNVHLASNWEVMADVNHVHEAHTEHRVFNQHAHHVHWAEQLLKLVHHQLKNVHCQYANRVHISMAH